MQRERHRMQRGTIEMLLIMSNNLILQITISRRIRYTFLVRLPVLSSEEERQARRGRSAGECAPSDSKQAPFWSALPRSSPAASSSWPGPECAGWCGSANIPNFGKYARYRRPMNHVWISDVCGSQHANAD